MGQRSSDSQRVPAKKQGGARRAGQVGGVNDPEWMPVGLLRMPRRSRAWNPFHVTMPGPLDRGRLSLWYYSDAGLCETVQCQGSIVWAGRGACDPACH